MSQAVKTELCETLKERPDTSQLGFGKHFTDYTLSYDYDVNKGWYDLKIVPYGPIKTSPAVQGVHYEQLVFGGLKAYKKDGEVALFRLDENFRRPNNSLACLEIPQVNGGELPEGLKQLVDLEREWVPEGEDRSLYIRPFVFATEGVLGVGASHQHKLLTILSLSGVYYGGETLKSTKAYVEDEHVHVVRGDVGFTKVTGNHAASLLAQTNADKLGYDQVSWLDGVEQKHIEEVGGMNTFFAENGKIITPELNGSILPGTTRKSIIELTKNLGYRAEERRVSIDELFESYDKGELTEVFGSGTATVTSPVGTLRYEGREVVINNNETGEITQKLYDAYTGIQNGTLEDKNGWRVAVSKYQ